MRRHSQANVQNQGVCQSRCLEKYDDADAEFQSTLAPFGVSEDHVLSTVNGQSEMDEAGVALHTSTLREFYFAGCSSGVAVHHSFSGFQFVKGFLWADDLSTDKGGTFLLDVTRTEEIRGLCCVCESCFEEQPDFHFCFVQPRRTTSFVGLLVCEWHMALFDRTPRVAAVA